jgi:hypothetical protein
MNRNMTALDNSRFSDENISHETNLRTELLVLVSSVFLCQISTSAQGSQIVVSRPTTIAVTDRGAILGGTIESDGGAPIKEVRVIVSFASITIPFTATQLPADFRIAVTNLSAGTIHKYRLYAITDLAACRAC